MTFSSSLDGTRTTLGSAMRWKFFLGACYVVGALLLPHAGVVPVVAGMILAGAMQWGWSMMTRRRDGGGRGA